MSQTVGRVRAVNRTVAPRSGRQLDPWAMCRLNPFSGGGALYPDGGQTRRIVLDFRTFANLSDLSGGQYSLLLVPSLPSPLWIKSSVDCTVANALGSYSYDASNAGNRYSALALQPEYSDQWPGGAINPYTAASARITSMGMRMVYTGQINTCSGTIYASSNPATVTSRGPTNVDMLIRSVADGSDHTVSANDANAIRLSHVPSFPRSAPGSTMAHAASGFSGIAQMNDPDLPFRAVSEEASILLADDMAGSQTSPLCSSNGHKGGVDFWDESWDPIALQLNGASANSSYAIEIAVCVEFLIAPASSVIRFAREPPRRNPSALAAVSNYLARRDLIGDADHIFRQAKAFSGVAAPIVKAALAMV